MAKNDPIEDDPEQNCDLFPFNTEDVFVIEELKERFRKLLGRPNTSPVRIRQIGTVLFALERLPRSTPGIMISIGPFYRFNDESSYCDLFISESSFRLSQGGSTYDPAVGGDRYSSTVLEVETSGYRAGSGDDPAVFDWFNQFDELFNLGAEISVEDIGEDSAVDWTEDFSGHYWDEVLGDDEWTFHP